MNRDVLKWLCDTADMAHEWPTAAKLHKEAADEITRLRADLAASVGREEIEEEARRNLEADVARLMADNESAVVSMRNGMKERVRLRQELRKEQEATLWVTDQRDKLRTDLAAAQVPLCIGRPIIGILAKEGAWVAEDGRAVVAADELFGADPYEQLEQARTDLAAARELLREAREYVVQSGAIDGGPFDMLARIDAALAKDEGRT